MLIHILDIVSAAFDDSRSLVISSAIWYVNQGPGSLHQIT